MRGWLDRSGNGYTFDPETEDVTYVSSNNNSPDEHRSENSAYAILEIHNGAAVSLCSVLERPRTGRAILAMA